ncbi:hypothetical protein M2451_003040 [Dysgonomonas sp. PFB1-18]|uniref:hypothetical protein n=1 Tax=unclassified Dysgonomonas TaxID=2630389 RepID=UPI0024753A38|nr:MULTISPECIES: hypothetical protein [unclassified Dysgonomonas]MDH6310148.1 hypothetical protein [Dysgonomonas sp. PF1-14]MDH6340186.1 hypothetical protein [Dysgonomonas sp. PF1-16]MDH6381705.1 hypothetical protein [Dysgonomonas sp. PFB1-18]MDH6399064.1 hypothetical protein [Dysgonomonas sp. PF1-23]
MKKEPINKDAFGYVKLHVYIPVSEDEFITIEKYVAEMHNSLYRNDSYGDADLRRFVYQKLTEENVFIEQSKVDAIVNSLYDYMFENGSLLPIDWVGKFNKWCNWKQTLSEAISEFILFHEYVPNVIIISEHTKSQIEFISQMTVNTEYEDIKKLLKFQIDNSLSNKRFILLYLPDDNDEDDGNPETKSPIDGKLKRTCIVPIA